MQVHAEDISSKDGVAELASDALKKWDAQLGGALADAVAAGGFDGKQGQVGGVKGVVVPAPSLAAGLPAVVGMGGASQHHFQQLCAISPTLTGAGILPYVADRSHLLPLSHLSPMPDATSSCGMHPPSPPQVSKVMRIGGASGGKARYVAMASLGKASALAPSPEWGPGPFQQVRNCPAALLRAGAHTPAYTALASVRVHRRRCPRNPPLSARPSWIKQAAPD